MKKRYIFLFCFIVVLLQNGSILCAQDTGIISGSVANKVIIRDTTDSTTIAKPSVSEAELTKIKDLRTQFEDQNNTYSAPVLPSEAFMNFLKKDELTMSDEAIYWIQWTRDPSTYIDSTLTLRDTAIVNPLFSLLVFKGDYLPKDIKLYHQDPFVADRDPYKELYKPYPIFAEHVQQQKSRELAYRYIQDNFPSYFRYSQDVMPQEIVEAKEIKKEIQDDEKLKVESDLSFDDVSAPAKFIPERRYWKSSFSSAFQFAEGYTSVNWHKGGSENVNLNLLTANRLAYDYEKDKVRITNEGYLNISLNNAPKDTLHMYKINENLIRLHSNVGYRAFNKWYYTFDANIQTQLLANYRENTKVKQAAFLAPLNMTYSLGMKYDLRKAFKKKHKNVSLSFNIAPLSYSFMYTNQDDQEKFAFGNYGFPKKKDSDIYDNKLHQFGSTIEGNLNFNFTRTISWVSRLYYKTNYSRIEAEFENTVNLAISRFFSTRIYLHLRYDDGVVKKKDFDTYLQVNEMISFGFNYKW